MNTPDNYDDVLDAIGETVCNAANFARSADERWIYCGKFLEYGEDDNGEPDSGCQYIVNAEAEDGGAFSCGEDLDFATDRAREIADAVAAAFNAAMGLLPDDECAWYVQSEPNYWDIHNECANEEADPDGEIPDHEIAVVQYCIFKL